MTDPSLSHLVSWAETTHGDIPPALTGPSLTLSPLSPPTLFLFGGKHVQSRRLSSELWALDLTTRQWSRVDAGPGPCPRYFHSMDVWEDQLVCFGGMSDDSTPAVHNDVWFLDCKTRSWSQQPEQHSSFLPPPRYAHLSAVSRGQLMIIGGQHTDNSWIFEINAYDLTRRVWVSKTPQPELKGLHTKGAYRSVACSSSQKVIRSSSTYSVEEPGQGGDVWMYSNYDFAKVRREIDLLSPVPSPSTPAPAPSNTQRLTPPPAYTSSDQSLVTNTSQPPGLRFPVGGIVGDHLILCGLYLASSTAAFSIWALNLHTMTWRHLDPAVLRTGSWNRAVLWSEEAKLLVFGNAEQDLAADYGKRAVNLDQIAVISLESYGIYRPPKLEIPVPAQSLNLAVLDEKIISDFDIVCDDGRKLKCSRRILAERWPWFKEQEAKLAAQVTELDTPGPSTAIEYPGPLSAMEHPGPTAMEHHGPTANALNLPEPFAVCVALVQYFYTLSISTPLQNRAPILSALLFLAKQYTIPRLVTLVVHALHQRLEPSTAVGIYELATLCGEQNLQVRALSMIHARAGSSRSQHRRDGSVSQSFEPASEGPDLDNQSARNDIQSTTQNVNGGGTTTGHFGGSHAPTQVAARPESPLMPDTEIEEIDELFDALYYAPKGAARTPPLSPVVARVETPVEPNAWRFARELSLNSGPSSPSASPSISPVATGRPGSSGSSFASIPMPSTPIEPAREGVRDPLLRASSGSRASPALGHLDTLQEAIGAEEPEALQRPGAKLLARTTSTSESIDLSRRSETMSRQVSEATSDITHPRPTDDAKSFFSSGTSDSELSWMSRRQLKKEQKKEQKAHQEALKRAEADRMQEQYRTVAAEHRRKQAIALAEQQRLDEIAVAEGKPRPKKRVTVVQSLSAGIGNGAMIYGGLA